jgi:tetrahydromethanopterin S-methyltransferase subunit G
VTPDDFNRVEKKVDQCLEAISRLIIIDERQNVQGQRIGAVEQRCAALETNLLSMEREFTKSLDDIRGASSREVAEVRQKMDKWINFGVGAWSLAVTLFAIWQAVTK